MLRAPVIALSCALLLGTCAKPAHEVRRAPLILISIDTLRADRLSAYGATHVATPAIDRLAADGIVFENAYAHVPLTLASHVTMLTGTLPWQNGVRSNIGYRFEGDPAATLPKLLAQRGYVTGAAVSAYVLRAETGIGPLFDFYDDALHVSESETLGALQRNGEETSRVAMRWIDSVRERPFFLFLHLFEPHSPYEPAEAFRAKYADPYDGEIATVDAMLGRFLAELDRRQLYDDALIVLVSDHGEGLGDHGEAEHGVLLYREAIHVPLIVKLPAKEHAGRRVEAPAQLVDLLPTITAIAGAPAPKSAAGISLLDLAEGRAAASRTIYGETLYPRLHLGWSHLRSVIDARHHYIESPAPELFDVVADAKETRNLRDERRRESHTFSRQLAAIPLNLTRPGNVSSEERARLAALGYLSAPASPSQGALRNPRDHVSVLARIQESFALSAQGRHRESAALCREILRDDPDLVDVHVQLAATLRRLGRLAEARDAYREAIRRSPQLVNSLAVEVGKLELDLGNLDAAELNARQALTLNPAEAHLLLAGVHYARREWSAAEREARLAVGREDAPRAPALVLLARALVEQGKLGEALSTIERVRHPLATLSSTRGDILARMGRTREAEAAFRDEIARFPTTSQAYVRLAILLASQRRFDEIEPTLEAMVTASPTPVTYQLAARAMSDLGNEEGARAFRKRGEKLAARLRGGSQSS